MDIRAYNRTAWNKAVEENNQWTCPVSEDVISKARKGDWEIVLTPIKPIPRNWFPEIIHNLDVLCLASGGGQQGPVIAAAGAKVTVFDNSPKQLAQDRFVAAREKLEIITVEGDMRDLSAFEDCSFDLIVHPVSNIFIPDIFPVWDEAFRVLRPGGALLSGIVNPVIYIFDRYKMDDEGLLEVRYRLPYSDLTSPSLLDRKRNLNEGWPLEFSHSLDEQIGGQIEAGFTIYGFYEDRDPRCILNEYMPIYIATRAVKPG